MKHRMPFVTDCIIILMLFLALLEGRVAAITRQDGPDEGEAAGSVFLPLVTQPFPSNSAVPRGFFIPDIPAIELSTSQPTIAIDATGGVHIALTPQNAAPTSPARPAYFALDPLGRPRFVYFDAGADGDDPHWGVFYAFCDGNCTTAANWYATRLLDDPDAYGFDLAFSPASGPRLVYATYNRDTLAQPVAFAECNQDCQSAANWSGIMLADIVSAHVMHFAAYALALDSNGKPRLALYTGTGVGGGLTPNTLYLLACDAAECAQAQTWSVLNLNLPSTHGEEGVDLVFDAQDRPRLAYHAPLAAGFGLYYAWCNANCLTAAQGWQYREIESSERVNTELPIPPWPGCAFPQCNPPIPPCTISTWDNGLRPVLALDAAGHPRLAYDAHHEQGGACGAFTDAKLTRFIPLNQPR